MEAFDGDWSDVIGGDTGIPAGPTNFVAGKVGLAMAFNGSSSSVRIPASTNLNVGRDGGMSVETWINPSNVTLPPNRWWKWNSNARWGLAASEHSSGSRWAASGGGVGSLCVNLLDASLTPHSLSTSPGLVVPNAYQHVALTYDKTSGSLAIYLNGNAVAQTNLGTNFVPNTTSDVYLGLRPPGGAGPVFYQGQLDEVSIYSRALTATEVQSIYTAGGGGKCQSPNPPYIFSQPASQTVVEGGNATFTVGVAGSAPFSYQWEFNGTNMGGATDSTLTVSNVQLSAAGSYAVVVSNAVGSATSSNAVLTVSLPPSIIQVLSVTATSGIVTVPIDLLSQGDENALGFSINFDSTLLSFSGISLGSNASGASLIYNANLASSGRLGVGIGLSANGTFGMGTQEVALVSFFVAASTNNRTAAISFGDQPILRQVVDPQANILLATYTGGTVTIPSVTNANSGIEGDISPVPGGDNAVTIADWVQEGRFVAGLDVITDASLFQRADCAPRATLGDGLLTIADWVQVGRYAVGLDPLTPAGGPSVPNGFTEPSGYSKSDFGRSLTVVPPPGVLAGQSFQASIQLNALGNENALGFSLVFDPAVLSFSSANLGRGAAGALFNANSYQAGSGKLGLALALPAGTAFRAGVQEVAQVTLVVSAAATNPASITFGNQPVLADGRPDGGNAGNDLLQWARLASPLRLRLQPWCLS